MPIILVTHIVAGSLGIISGFIALFSTKGAPIHQRVGTVFVYSMLTMSAAGFTLTVVKGAGTTINVPAALLTAALVVTALTALRPPSTLSRWLNRTATVVTTAVAVACALLAAEAVRNGGQRNGIPAFPFVLFGVVAALAAIGDFRIVRSGPPRGARRLARHLWRMSFALFIAAMSFFIGQAKVIPGPLRITPLLALPVLTVLATMFYWLWRIRIRQALRGVVRAREVEGVR